MHVRAVGINTTGHAAQSQKMKREERNVETDEEEPEMPLSQRCIGHSPSHLREPEINAGEHGEKSTADQHIVKVRNNKVSIVDLQIDRHGRQHDSGQSADQKHEEETEAPEHR